MRFFKKKAEIFLPVVSDRSELTKEKLNEIISHHTYKIYRQGFDDAQSQYRNVCSCRIIPLDDDKRWIKLFETHDEIVSAILAEINKGD